MALALTVDSLDSVPEAFRGEYVADGDKFKLSVDGLEDTAGLKSALAAERALNKTQKTELAAFKKSGKSAAEIAEFVEAQEAAAAEAAKKAGNFDSILAQHKAASAAEKAAADKRADSAMSVARKAVVNSNLLGALAKAKAMLDQQGTSEFLTDRLGKRVILEIDDDGEHKIQIMQADGKTPMAGSGADGSATFDDLVKEAVKTWPNQFEGTGAGGGGTPPKGGGKPGDKTITRADFDKLGPVEKAAILKTHKLVD